MEKTMIGQFTFTRYYEIRVERIDEYEIADVIKVIDRVAKEALSEVNRDKTPELTFKVEVYYPPWSRSRAFFNVSVVLPFISGTDALYDGFREELQRFLGKYTSYSIA